MKKRYRIREGSIADWAGKIGGMVLYSAIIIFMMYECASTYVKYGGF